MEIWTILILPFCLMDTLLVTEVNGATFLEKVCLQPSDEGRDCGVGKVNSTWFFTFSEDKEECVPLEYLGCGGNDNRFKLQDDCTDSCQIDYFKKKNKKGKGRRNGDLESGEERTFDDCLEPRIPGPCRALIPMWYFDEDSKLCEPFNYGGCKGTRNRFDTEALCKQTCEGKKESEHAT